jgi:hypothetical protein
VEAGREDAGQARLSAAQAEPRFLRFHGARAYARVVARSLTGLAAAVLACGGMGCGQAPGPGEPRLWTVADMQAAVAAGETAVARGPTLPGGIDLSRVLNDGTLVHHEAIADQYGAAYVTTEVWLGYPQVWIQPMYVPISGWSPTGAPLVIGDAATGAWKPVFSVGPSSGFYSPFWQALYFQAPPGTTADTYTSAKQILDAGLPLTEGAGWTIPIVPDDLAWKDAAADRGAGWLNGAPVTTLSFGTGLFHWDPATNVVAEVPLFVFVMRNASGALVAPGLRTVAGTGPIGSGGGPAPTVGGETLYSSYWRLYTVEVPSTAAVFADAALQAELAADGLPAAPPIDAGVIAANPDVVGWVVTNPDCLTGGMPVAPALGYCVYLDSQARIESQVPPAAIHATDVTVTCPFVTEREGASPLQVTPVR